MLASHLLQTSGIGTDDQDIFVVQPLRKQPGAQGSVVLYPCSRHLWVQPRAPWAGHRGYGEVGDGRSAISIIVKALVG